MIVVLMVVVVPTPPSRGAAADSEAGPREETSTANNRAVVRVVHLRNHQPEFGKDAPELQVSVFVFNSADIASPYLMRAEAQAAGIFETLGIKLIWVVGLTVRDLKPHSKGAPGIQGTSI
jgi:hypothetical protein